MNKLFPNSTVIITKNFDIHQDWEIPIPGFFILATQRKIKSIAEFTDDEAQEYILLLRKLRQGMKEKLNIGEVYFFQNEDSSSGFHVWIFPRLEWMKKFGKKIQSVRPIMEYAKEHMVTDEVIQQVEEYARIMNEYMN